MKLPTRANVRSTWREEKLEVEEESIELKLGSFHRGSQPQDVLRSVKIISEDAIGVSRALRSSLTEQKEDDHKTIVVSNRLPLKISKDAEGISAVASTGGLATGMKSVHANGNGLWIGWSGLAEEELDSSTAKAVAGKLEEANCAGVNLTQAEVEDYYLGFSNNALWPLFHYFLEYAKYDDKQWEAYKRVNEKFADVVCACLEDGDDIWIHDYQLLLLPKLIRDRKPKATIGFFLHIPFPSWEILR